MDTYPAVSGVPSMGPRRALEIGRVISETFRLLGRRLVAIATIAIGVAFLEFLFAFAASYGFSAAGLQNAVPMLAAGSAGVVAFLLHGVAAGAICRVAVADLDGRRVGAAQGFATGFRLLFPLLGLSIVVGLGVALGLVLLVVPGLMLAMRWFIVTPVRVVEGPSIGRALSRSAELTKGSRWRLFALAVCWAILSFAITKLFAAIGAAFAGPDVATNLFEIGLWRLVASAITTSISATGISIVYVNLRRLVEGASVADLAAVFS